MVETSASNKPPSKSIETEFQNISQPIQANHLLELELKLSTGDLSNQQEKLISSGWAETDKLLGGGIERGCVVGVSCEGIEGRILTLNFLASILILQLKVTILKQSLPTKAIIIDSTGSFPLTLFASILKSRIISYNQISSILIDNTDRNSEHEDVGSQMQRCLKMVNFSRIFDIEGLWEVLDEIDNGKCNPTEDQNPPNTVPFYDYLDTKEKSRDQTINSEAFSAQYLASNKSAKNSSDSGREGIEVILVDNMTTLISGFLSCREKVNAHEHLVLLSKTLRILTRQRNILTLIHNTTVNSKSVPTNTLTATSQTIKSVSVFPSNPLKPALGQIFAQFSSLHIFLSQLPRLRKDAQLLEQADTHQNNLGEFSHINYATVIEILKDESWSSPFVKKGIGWREGTWTAVDINQNCTGFICTFPNKKYCISETIDMPSQDLGK